MGLFIPKRDFSVSLHIGQFIQNTYGKRFMGGYGMLFPDDNGDTLTQTGADVFGALQYRIPRRAKIAGIIGAGHDHGPGFSRVIQRQRFLRGNLHGRSLPYFTPDIQTIRQIIAAASSRFASKTIAYEKNTPSSPTSGDLLLANRNAEYALT
jgi:hypothetical protein